MHGILSITRSIYLKIYRLRGLYLRTSAREECTKCTGKTSFRVDMKQHLFCPSPRKILSTFQPVMRTATSRALPFEGIPEDGAAQSRGVAPSSVFRLKDRSENGRDRAGIHAFSRPGGAVHL
jgi:hypothetical protein